MAALLDVENQREVSRHLFGNRYKLEVMCEVARIRITEEPVVYARQVAQRLSGPADNQVRQVLLQLAAADLLAPVEEKRESRAIRYHVKESAVWDLVLALARELEDAE